MLPLLYNNDILSSVGTNIHFPGKDAKNMVADEFSRDCRNVEK